jgi:membrane-associated protein
MVLDDVLDWLETLSTNPWFYVAIFGIALLDAVVPIVPGETTVILGGIAAGQGHLSLFLVIALAALGAGVGDSFAYWLGRRSGDWLKRRLFNNDKRAARLDWAEEQLAKRGGTLLVTARFVPGGRTAVTLSSGITRQPYERFLLFDGLACVLWASYAALLGYVFGEQFKDDHTKAFYFAFGAALFVAALIELVRWFRHRHELTEA